MFDKSLMYAASNAKSFPAILTAENGKRLESGHASLDFQHHTVDFTSDFVPLFSLGTRLTITRMLGFRELHRFYGEVYLSSESLLRLRNVEDQAVSGSESAYLYDVNLEGDILPQRARQPESHPLFFWRKIQIGKIPVVITSLASTGMEFTCEQQFTTGQFVRMSCGGPPALENVELEIKDVLAFGSSDTEICCFGEISNIPPDSASQLNRFISQLHEHLYQIG